MERGGSVITNGSLSEYGRSSSLVSLTGTIVPPIMVTLLSTSSSEELTIARTVWYPGWFAEKCVHTNLLKVSRV